MRWREKVIRATMSADCAEIGMFHKIRRFTLFGEIGESPDKIIFYCQHNNINLFTFLKKNSLLKGQVYRRYWFAFGKTSWSNKPTEFYEYARVIKQAYRIEESFHRAKGECGLADYQVRNWKGWHHHVALNLLTLWFLTEELLNQKKRTDDDVSTSSRMFQWFAFAGTNQRVRSSQLQLLSQHLLAQQNQASHRKLPKSKL